MSDHVALAGLLVHTKHGLAAVRDAHVQLRLLTEAGDSRYLGWAIDDLDSSLTALDKLDARRRTITGETAAQAWIDSAPDDLALAMGRSIAEITNLLAEIHEERSRARRATHTQLRAFVTGLRDGEAISRPTNLVPPAPGRGPRPGRS